MTDEKRSAHPYHMYDSIREQPDRVARVLETQREPIERAAAAAASKKRLIFAGIGTSLHAAICGEHFLRHLSGGRAHAQVEQSFELVHYPIALSADDALIVASHRGWKNFSVEAVRRAKAAGALTIAVTGFDGGDGIRAADHVIPTCEQELSFAHTKSYTTAQAALALFAINIAEQRKWLADSGAARKALAQIPKWIEGSLALEDKARAIAREIAKKPRIFFIGAGPNWATATEGALKVKEAAYLAAEGLEIEQLLHGPLAEVDSGFAVVMIFSGDTSDARAAEAWTALGELGALRIAIGSFTKDDTKGASPSVVGSREGEGTGMLSVAAEAAKAGHLLEVPPSAAGRPEDATIPEWLSSLVHVVPVQLLSYFLALERGTNPDSGREDQPSHARAKKHFAL